MEMISRNTDTPSSPLDGGECGPAEDAVARRLLQSGFSFLGVQMYEALLSLKLLRWLDGVDHGRIAMIGHSGGSGVANVLVRLESDDLAAFVSDYQTTYGSLDIAPGELLLNTFVPGLYPQYIRINDFETSSVPAIAVDYGYPDFDAVVDFFDAEFGG
ncbi:MAG: hypothetical protein M5R36_16005 [Deltaproteobacteria bacterium]|nr:hypothetical protein [Deltaproteobacteria bacterium]